MNNNVYITNSKIKEILREIRPEKNYTDQQLEKLYKIKISHILSRREMAGLQILKELYEEENFVISSYKKIQKQYSKNSRYVFNKTKAPSYHFRKECTALTSTFENYKIPDEIAKRGDQATEEFRSFFIENINLLREKPDVFLIRMETKFKLHEPIEHILIENSGVHEIENLDLAELEKRIDQILIDAEIFKSRDPETKKLIDTKGYGTDRELRKPQDQDCLETLAEWHTKYKGGLKYLLGEYFRVKLNPDLEFKSTLLDQLGFRPCKICTPDFHEII